MFRLQILNSRKKHLANQAAYAKLKTLSAVSSDVVSLLHTIVAVTS